MRNLKSNPKFIIATLCTLSFVFSVAFIANAETVNDFDTDEATNPDAELTTTEDSDDSDEMTEIKNPQTDNDDVLDFEEIIRFNLPEPTSDSVDSVLSIDVIQINGIDVLEIQRTDNDSAISAKGMYLTDDIEDPYKWQMPSVIVRPNSAVIVKGEEDEITQNLKRMQANFDISSANSIWMFSSNGEVIAHWERDNLTEVEWEGFYISLSGLEYSIILEELGEDSPWFRFAIIMDYEVIQDASWLKGVRKGNVIEFETFQTYGFVLNVRIVKNGDELYVTTSSTNPDSVYNYISGTYLHAGSV